MIITAYNPEVDHVEKTYLSQYVGDGANALTVKNSQGFATSRRILIGRMGDERSELATIASLTGKTQIGITGALQFSHNADDPIYLLEWDKVRFYRANTSAGPYTLLSTEDLDVDNADGMTKYDDPAALSTHYYQITFYNSITLNESDASDPIKASGFEVKTVGKLIDKVVRRVRDTRYETLSIPEYIDVMNEVNHDLITQSLKPYRFLRKRWPLSVTANQDYVSLPIDLWKYERIEYTYTLSGVSRTYEPDIIEMDEFNAFYKGTTWTSDDYLRNIAIDDTESKILLGPAPLTTRANVINLWGYKSFAEITDLSQVVETPNTLIYFHKMMSAFYFAKAEKDKQWLALAREHETKYGNEIVKMQRVNRIDVGTPRSFSPNRIPGYRRRYRL